MYLFLWQKIICFKQQKRISYGHFFPTQFSAWIDWLHCWFGFFFLRVYLVILGFAFAWFWLGWGRICKLITSQGKLADYFHVNNCPNVNYESHFINLSRPLIVLDLCGLCVRSAKNMLGPLKWRCQMFLWITVFPSYLQNKNYCEMTQVYKILAFRGEKHSPNANIQIKEVI